MKKGKPSQSVADQAAIKALFPRTYGQPELSFVKGKAALSLKPIKVGVVLSGGQAPGGHNVLSGIFDGLKKINKASKLYGFLGGPSGISDNKYVEITPKLIHAYRNTGGFDIIGSGRTKLESKEQFEACAANLKKLGISALVVVGGDDSNTNAAVLAEYFAAKEHGIRVVGCPKTIDGDLKNEQIETSFGFDTATKVYSELIGNVSRDALSAKKYWHFIKLMGRSASHIGLECALKCQPNVALISEEVAAKKQTLDQVTEQVARSVADRAAQGKNYGIALVPEGLVEFVPEMKSLIAELNDMLAHEEDAFNALTAPSRPRSILWPPSGTKAAGPPSHPCPKRSRASSWPTAIPMAMSRSAASRPRSCSWARWPPSWPSGRRKARPRAPRPSSRHYPISSATKAGPWLPAISTRTTAMPWALPPRPSWRPA